MTIEELEAHFFYRSDNDDKIPYYVRKLESKANDYLCRQIHTVYGHVCEEDFNGSSGICIDSTIAGTEQLLAMTAALVRTQKGLRDE